MTTNEMKFLSGGVNEGFTVNHAEDPKIALLAVCVAHQQKAGFKNAIDIRETACPECKAPGFNTGWGVFLHTCGCEMHPDGTEAAPCKEGNDAG